MPGIKLRMIASGLGIDKMRRENLYALTYGLVENYSKHQNLDQLTDQMLGLTQNPNELEFMCSSFDGVLKKYYKSPLTARATLVTALRQTIQSRFGSDAPPYNQQ